MPPNFVHALDAAHMSLVIDALCKMGIDFFSFIHDSFGVLAPYIPMLRDITKETFYEIHSQDQLERLLKRSEELVGKPLPDDHPAWHHFQQRGQLDIQQVLESEYLFG
jgi:DNA-directed RNA polymerase